MSSSSSSSTVSSSRRIGEEKNANPPLTGMDLGFQRLEEQIIETTTPCHSNTTQQLLRVPPSIIDIVGCNITIEDIQLAKRELINQGVDLTMDVNKYQQFPWQHSNSMWEVTPLVHFCWTGNLRIVQLLFLISTDRTTVVGNHSTGFSPMHAAAQRGHSDICKWLFEYGGDAKYHINTETSDGYTPLWTSYLAWRCGRNKEGTTCRWLLRQGGGQLLSSQAMRLFVIDGVAGTNSNLLVLWTRENIQLYDTFLLLLCGVATTMIATTTLSSSESSDGSAQKHKRKKRKIHQERSLQILDGHPGIMELIGNYVGLLRGKEFRMLKEFNGIINHTTDENESSSDDDNSDDEE